MNDCISEAMIEQTWPHDENERAAWYLTLIDVLELPEAEV